MTSAGVKSCPVSTTPPAGGRGGILPKRARKAGFGIPRFRRQFPRNEARLTAEPCIYAGVVLNKLSGSAVVRQPERDYLDDVSHALFSKTVSRNMHGGTVICYHGHLRTGIPL